MTRKLGPLPVWAWAIIVLVVGYFLYKRFASTGSTQSAPVPAQTAQPASDSSGALGLTPSAGAPADTGQTTSDLVTALGGQQASLLAALEQANQDVVGLAQSQISALQQQTTAGPFQTQTATAVGSQPGGSNAPVVAFASPTVTGSVSTPTGGSAKVTSAQTKPTRYYTFKTQVPLAHGQTLHFTAGKGYYAA